MSEEINIVYQKLHEAQEKYTYYILGIDVVVIGFIIANNQIIKLIIQNIPLGISIILLSLSFLFGMRQIEYVNSTIYANMELLKIKAGIHPDVPRQREYIDAASDGVKMAIENNSNKIQRLGNWQGRLLILGLLAYFTSIIIKSL
jgi:hypothetical protein